jgi:hypothetical protein
MKTWKAIGIAGLVLTSIYVWSGPVQAQYYGGIIDQREAAQQHRIHNGIESGALTPQEAWKLRNEQRRIQTAENRMRADGRLNSRERARLDGMQDRADRHIYREKHDNQTAYSGYGNHRDGRSRQWQHNQQRDHGQGNHYSRRDNGCDRGTAYRPTPGNQGRFSRIQHREHRTAWNR